MRHQDEEANLELIRQGETLSGIHLHSLDLHQVNPESISEPIKISGCTLGDLDASLLTIHASIEFDFCVFDTVNLFSTYMLLGARFSNCVFKGTVIFECGGHNRIDAPFILEDCTFHDFVSFFDCWYSEPVTVRRCNFLAGINLLGNVGQPYMVAFDIEPNLEGNTGVINLSGG